MSRLRKRITSRPATTGGGGGGSPGTGVVEWGAAFGGTDGDAPRATCSMVTGQLALEAQINGTGSMGNGEAHVSFAQPLQALCSSDAGVLEYAATLNGNGVVASLTYETGEILASKDSFTPTAQTLGNCNDNANKNGQDLRVGNVLLVENTPVIYFAFNLTGFPANATVTQALLSLKPTAAPLLGHDYHVRGIASAGENWTEAGITCSTRPALTAPDHTFTQPSNANDLTLDITAAFASYIAGRMGSANTCTLAIEDREAVGQIQVYESKDEGTNNAQGPRLQLRLTVPVT